MFRYEPDAELRCDERATPDPRHRGVSFVERNWSLVTGRGETIELRPGAGEAVEAAHARRPQIVAVTEDRFWWMYEGRLYSAVEWHSPAEVVRLADGRDPRDSGDGMSRSVGLAMVLPFPAQLLPAAGDVALLLAV